jgi:hypothetical protein
MASPTTTSRRVRRSFSAIPPGTVRIWEDLQNAARSVSHGLTDGHDAIISDSIASTTLGFVGRIDRLDGKVIAFDGRSQLGWQCIKGAWKIRHEMNYAWIVEPAAIEKFLGRHNDVEPLRGMS